ncbi:GNAT family N-acetyltransferase [Palleronia abyssalis]|uniref:N-acetyltransferase domain-containing protein n=1 Tax=Palleronia abyssalis TaxID=1501240 RepID=A0A2R8BWD4_9RHOB|nr:GNAT family N-acetyltransferase [Palleronia abyssalis]SPJ24460.1 hypothetical protein PAA8504_02291 [Palleronia abyssalis]
MNDTTVIPRIETGDLVLRAPQATDLDAHAAFRASDRSRAVGGPWQDRASAWLHLCSAAGQWVLRGYGRWIVADRTTDAPLGLVGLHHPDDWPEPEIGWTVYAHAEGRGIAFAAAQAARAYAYDRLGWRTVISAVAPDNARSMALANRMGCTPDGSFPFEDEVLTIMRHPAPEAA